VATKGFRDRHLARGPHLEAQDNEGPAFIKSRITDTGGYDQYNTPYLDFEKDVVQANAGSGNFVWDGHTAAHIIRGKGIPTPPPTNLGHFHENMVEL